MPGARRNMALTDIAITWSRFDVEQAKRLADDIPDPAFRACILATSAMRMGSPSDPECAALLSAATEELKKPGSPRHKAYAGYIVARAWCDLDCDLLLARADALTFELDAW